MFLTGIRQMELMKRSMPEIKNETDVLIRMKVVGVCGSDIHYYTSGKIGTQVVKYPFPVGHEGSGDVIDIGERVSQVKVGDRIAIEPAMPCKRCDQCLAGRPHFDASVYSEKPLAVACQKNRRDINKIIHFLRKLKIPIIRRTVGTSLAGQVVGNGIVVNVSRYMNEIWTELTQELSNAGVYYYSIYLDEETNTLFAVQKITDSNTADQLPQADIVCKWWDFISGIIEVNLDNSPIVVKLKEVFHQD
jgi:Threonine dehydrogenase and related Zn-dependent dehydrogenases